MAKRRKPKEIPYSGRTMAHEHQGDDWRTRVVADPQPAITRRPVMEVADSDCPVEVADELRKMWDAEGYPNWSCQDIYVDELEKDWPIVWAYLLNQGISGDRMIVIIYGWGTHTEEEWKAEERQKKDWIEFQVH